MSTDWYYRFRAPLRDDLCGLGLDGIRERAPERFRGVCFALEPPIREGRAEAPFMGPDTTYDHGRLDGTVGASTEGGEIRLGIWCQNLEREPSEDEDGITRGARGTRLDLLLGLLSWATVGRPGEVVGCISAEWDDGHAHPLVRLGDGLIRLCRTEPRDYGGHWLNAGDDGEAVLPELLPLDLIRIVDEATATVDCHALRRRFLAVDGSLATMQVAGRGSRNG